MKILCAGLATVDLLYRVDQIPAADEKAQASSMEVAAGGPAANAAITAATLGAEVTLVTAIGSHPLATLILQDLQAHDVRVVDAAHASSVPPPVSTVLVAPSGARTIISRNAGDHVYDPPPMPPADLTLIDGHHPALAAAAASSARRLVIDAGTWRPIFPSLIPYAEVVACSETFRHPAAPTGPDAMTAAALGCPHVAVTHGPAPVTWFSGNTSGAIPVPSVTALDTAGAGDAFHGALAFSLAAGSALPTALTDAVRVAALRVQHPGPRAWLRHLR
ncbi:PfkB family carbohydrate kinase [Actinoplanes solisilvae]|uniref:PfkB family carbohydrate kinase n=1 Tax=Actinoplanes solisilvae TaxID=2486853 RepID=UPI000FDB2A4B|nr:PfkB family carbohydrate kinase [Actinoplanes solisilvae]